MPQARQSVTQQKYQFRPNTAFYQVHPSNVSKDRSVDNFSDILAFMVYKDGWEAKLRRYVIAKLSPVSPKDDILQTSF